MLNARGLWGLPRHSLGEHPAGMKSRTAKVLQSKAVLGFLMCWVPAFVGGCGDDGDNSGTQADRMGVGAQCAIDGDCLQIEDEIATTCLLQFKGGYCGLVGCLDDAGCPMGSSCVLHDDGQAYCFRTCQDKSECNLNRSPQNESNCSANVDFVAGTSTIKACVPPSG